MLNNFLGLICYPYSEKSKPCQTYEGYIERQTRKKITKKKAPQRPESPWCQRNVPDIPARGNKKQPTFVENSCTVSIKWYLFLSMIQSIFLCNIEVIDDIVNSFNGDPFFHCDLSTHFILRNNPLFAIQPCNLLGLDFTKRSFQGDNFPFQ